jgi:hypothetical protein
MKPPRKPISPGVETAVLANSARRCALCFHLNGDLTEKIGQIAHLDGNRNNPAEDNLAFMCLSHHSLFDSKTSQHKNYTIPEVKAARTKLYDLVSNGNHLSLATAQPYLQAEADKKILRDLMETVPSNGSIRFLRENNFAGFSFDRKRLENIEVFLYERDGPEHEFLDSELEMAQKKFRKECNALMEVLSMNTWRTEQGFQSVPQEWEWEQPQRFKDTVNEIHAAAKAVCGTYNELVRLARKKLAV